MQLLRYRKDVIQDGSVDRGASILREPSPPNSDCETEIVSEEDQGNDSDGGASDVSVVKIMSDDPMAAARAAAILKMVRMVHSLLIIFSLTGMIGLRLDKLLPSPKCMSAYSIFASVSYTASVLS